MSDWQTALAEIKMAFSNNKPAIISTHRLNFIGSLVEKNRNNGLKLLQELLLKVILKWPDIVFMSSDELLDTMNKESI